MLLLTALAVGVDAYFAGLAYSLARRLRVRDILIVGVVTLIVCLIAGQIKRFLFHSETVTVLSAMLFVALGARAYYDSLYGVGDKSYHSLCALALAVSADAALASVAYFGASAVVVAIVMAVVHSLFVWLGGVTSRLAPAFKGASKLSGVGLIAIGLLRLV